MCYCNIQWPIIFCFCRKSTYERQWRASQHVTSDASVNGLFGGKRQQTDVSLERKPAVPLTSGVIVSTGCRGWCWYCCCCCAAVNAADAGIIIQSRVVECRQLLSGYTLIRINRVRDAEYGTIEASNARVTKPLAGIVDELSRWLQRGAKKRNNTTTEDNIGQTVSCVSGHCLLCMLPSGSYVELIASDAYVASRVGAIVFYSLGN